LAKIGNIIRYVESERRTKMKRLAVILMLVMVFGYSFLCEAASKNNPKQVTKTPSLKVFVNSVLGRTREDIRAKWGKPTCENPAGMIYEHFVKDPTGGHDNTVFIEFEEGFPIGTVLIREGRRVVGLEDSIRWVASAVICPYGTYSIKDSGNIFIQNYNIYFKPTYGGVPLENFVSCDEMKGYTGAHYSDVGK
jgi:hypothetical protein